MEKKILDIINEIREDKGEGPVTVIKPETSLRNELGFDSMDLATLTARIDEEFGVDVFEDGVIDLIGEVEAKLK